MEAAGMITEYNPFHGGHQHLIRAARELLGADTAIIACMSGGFVQRGDLAVLRSGARARAAVMCGVDLVIELPLPWCVSSAEGFADGGVAVLMATGIVNTLLFGSERGSTAALRRAAAALLREDFPPALREELAAGDSFPAARQRALARIAGAETAAALSRPNDLLGVEYCKSLLRRNAAIRPVAVKRTGCGHDALCQARTEGRGIWRKMPSEPERAEAVPAERIEEAGQTADSALPSSSLIRELLRRGEREKALSLLPPGMREVYREEEASGRAPVFYENIQRAILSRLRRMGPEEYAALDEGREGLSRRLYRASREAATLPELLDRAKTKRYPLARLRRMVLWAFLGIRPSERPREPYYIRPLAMNRRGRELLSEMRRSASVPILTKAAHGKRLGERARELLEVEARGADLYALAYPRLDAARPGALWREPPWIAPEEN